MRSRQHIRGNSAAILRALEQENEQLRDRMKVTIDGIAKLAMEMLALKGPKLVAHSRRTAEYAAAIGAHLNMDGAELDQLYTAALLHEIAHIRIPSHMLGPTLPIREAELHLVQDNFKRGIKLLAQIPDLAEVSAAISFQHDHFDGHSSPDRLSGEQIPLHSRIIAIADAYDEMREPHTMQQTGLGHNDALHVVQAAAGRKYDPSLVAIFSRIDFDQSHASRSIDRLAA